jgi:hypothetical protein
MLTTENNMNELYVLQIRYTGDEDDVFLFRTKQDAELKVFEYFEEKPTRYKSLEELESIYFREDKGYFTITTQPIQ